jgi:hypothetical protein
VESIFDSKDRSVRESHFDHHLSWSFRQGGNIPPIWARAKGRDTRLVAITWTDEFQALITLPGRGIHAPEQLAGRRFGVPARVNDLIDFHRATALKGLVSGLSLAGLSHRDVELVDLVIEESIIQEQDTPSLFGCAAATLISAKSRPWCAAKWMRSLSKVPKGVGGQSDWRPDCQRVRPSPRPACAHQQWHATYADRGCGPGRATPRPGGGTAARGAAQAAGPKPIPTRRCGL